MKVLPNTKQVRQLSGSRGQSSSYPMATPHLFLGFDNESFFPGQEVTGVLVLVVTQPVKALTLQVHWCGALFFFFVLF
jgi:hypothetical protein